MDTSQRIMWVLTKPLTGEEFKYSTLLWINSTHLKGERSGRQVPAAPVSHQLLERSHFWAPSAFHKSVSSTAGELFSCPRLVSGGLVYGLQKRIRVYLSLQWVTIGELPYTSGWRKFLRFWRITWLLAILQIHLHPYTKPYVYVI